MRKVGIITLSGLTNYGNRLQAFALSKVLENLKFKPVLICYCETGLKVFLKERVKRNRVLLLCLTFLLGVLRRNKLAFIFGKCKRLNLFSAFSSKMKDKVVFSDSNRIDYYVCGSDQIWNPNFAGQSSYFAAFATKEKRISYAASFGISELPENVADRYKQNLLDMKCISVREKAGADIVKELTGREAPVLVDPTFLLDVNEWKLISKKPKFNIPDKYILTYFLGTPSEETDAYIKNLAAENDMEIISLKKYKEDNYWYGTGPAEFIWLVENASIVCTDSFHASVFSILMDSPFVVFRRFYKDNDMHSRIESLLSMFELTDRFYEQIQKGNEFKKDYNHVHEILKNEREKAIFFLKNALNVK